MNRRIPRLIDRGNGPIPLPSCENHVADWPEPRPPPVVDAMALAREFKRLWLAGHELAGRRRVGQVESALQAALGAGARGDEAARGKGGALRRRRK